MKMTFFIGLLLFGIGLGFSYLTDGIIQAQTNTALQTTSTLIASILFLSMSGIFLGIGAALLLHWVLSFGHPLKAFAAELFFSVAVFFTGLGVTFTADNTWTALQAFFTFSVAAISIFIVSFSNFFGGAIRGAQQSLKYAKKFTKRWKW